MSTIVNIATEVAEVASQLSNSLDNAIRQGNMPAKSANNRAKNAANKAAKNANNKAAKNAAKNANNKAANNAAKNANNKAANGANAVAKNTAQNAKNTNAVANAVANNTAKNAKNTNAVANAVANNIAKNANGANGANAVANAANNTIPANNRAKNTNAVANAVANNIAKNANGANGANAVANAANNTIPANNANNKAANNKAANNKAANNARNAKNAANNRANNTIPANKRANNARNAKNAANNRANNSANKAAKNKAAQNAKNKAANCINNTTLTNMFSKYKLVSSSNYSSFNRVVNLIDTMYHNSEERTIKYVLDTCHGIYSTGNYNNTDAIYIVIGEIYYCMVNSKNISQNMYKKLFSLYSLSNPSIYKGISLPVDDMISMISIFDKICEIVNFNTPLIHYIPKYNEFIKNSVKISRIKTKVFDSINNKNEYIIEYYGAYTNTFESTRYYINHERLRYDYKCVNVIVYDNISKDFVLFTLQDNTWTPTFTNETAKKIEEYESLFDSPERRLKKYTDLQNSRKSMYDILNDILNTKLPACTNKLTELENDLKPLEKTLKKLKKALKYNTSILKVSLIPKSQKTNIQAKISTLTKSIADTQKSIDQHKSDINTTQDSINQHKSDINKYEENTDYLENTLQSMRTRQNTKINLPQRLIVQCTVYQKQ
jgi:hypothetical protein